MGHVHLIRSGGIPNTGKTLLASMLYEFCRVRGDCHYIDAQKSPDIGLKYSPELNSGNERIWFDRDDLTRVDRLIELAKNSQVIVDVPASTDYLATQWINDIHKLIHKGSVQVADWFVNNQTRASWAASQVQAKFWQDLGLRTTPQIFVLNGYHPTEPGSFPSNAKQQCWDNNVALMLFCAPEGIAIPKNQTMRDFIDNSRYPYAKILKEWRGRCRERFMATLLIPEPPQKDFSGMADLREIAYLALGRTQLTKTAEEIDDAPWI